MSLVKGSSIQNCDFISFYEKVSSFFLLLPFFFFFFLSLLTELFHDSRFDKPLMGHILMNNATPTSTFLHKFSHL
jgi:hypothetical protein